MSPTHQSRQMVPSFSVAEGATAPLAERADCGADSGTPDYGDADKRDHVAEAAQLVIEAGAA